MDPIQKVSLPDDGSRARFRNGVFLNQHDLMDCVHNDNTYQLIAHLRQKRLEFLFCLCPSEITKRMYWHSSITPSKNQNKKIKTYTVIILFLFCVIVKISFSQWSKTIDRGWQRTGCWGESSYIRGRKCKADGTYCVMSGFMFYTFRPVWLAYLSRVG